MQRIAVPQYNTQAGDHERGSVSFFIFHKIEILRLKPL